MKKILFFVHGFAPSGFDMKESAKIDGPVQFRNVELYDENAPLEECDGVAGAAPTPYLEKFGAIATKRVAEPKSTKIEKAESE